MHKLSKVRNGCKYAVNNKTFYATFPWQDFSPDTSLTFSEIPDISLTVVKFPDISRFSRQVVTCQSVCKSVSEIRVEWWNDDSVVETIAGYSQLTVEVRLHRGNFTLEIVDHQLQWCYLLVDVSVHGRYGRRTCQPCIRLRAWNIASIVVTLRLFFFKLHIISIMSKA